LTATSPAQTAPKQADPHQRSDMRDHRPRISRPTGR
jgi:hypothetical protein